MKIAIFSDTFLPQVNGVSRVMEKYKNYMDKMDDIRYTFLIPDKEGYFSKNNDKIIGFKGVKFPLYPDADIALPRYSSIDKALDVFQPDIVHLVTPFSMGVAGIKYAKAHNLPMIASYHTNFDQYLHYYHLSLLVRPVNRYMKWFHSFSEINFCPSQITRQQLQELGIKNIEICPNGVDGNMFSPQFRNNQIRKLFAADDGTPVLLYVGRIAAEKNLSLLMHAAQILNHSHTAFKLLLAGDGPAREELTKANIENVVFLGFKSGRELQEIYASADIFVFPSSTETFGNVILEAMSSGLPVVAARAGGVKDSVSDMVNGITFPPDDPEEMAGCIRKLIMDQNLRAEMAANARAYALTKNWNDIFGTFFTRLQYLLDHQKKSKPNPVKIMANDLRLIS